MKTILTILGFSVLLISQGSEARELVSGIQQGGEEVKGMIRAIGPVAIALAGGFMYISRERGLSMFGSALVGTIVFAASATIFALVIGFFD